MMVIMRATVKHDARGKNLQSTPLITRVQAFICQWGDRCDHKSLQSEHHRAASLPEDDPCLLPPSAAQLRFLVAHSS